MKDKLDDFSKEKSDIQNQKILTKSAGEKEELFEVTNGYGVVFKGTEKEILARANKFDELYGDEWSYYLVL